MLDVAERLVQRQGYNGFSYGDVAAELGITKAALHYHFATKGDLGEAIVRRYAARFTASLVDLDTGQTGSLSKIAAYIGLYADVFRDDRMCLCGMLAAEFETLPTPIQHAVRAFLDDNETWLSEVLEQGRRDGDLAFVGDAAGRARSVVASLEGAMLVARPYGDPGRFEAAASQILEDLAP